MTRKELNKLVSDRTSQTQVFVDEFLKHLEDVVFEQIKQGEEVALLGVVFDSEHVESRTAKNPKTGESVLVQAHTKATVKKRKALKDLFK